MPGKHLPDVEEGVRFGRGFVNACIPTLGFYVVAGLIAWLVIA